MYAFGSVAFDHFDFDTISSPQTVGSPFTITIKAKDQYGNTVTSYAGTNTLIDSTGTISPTSTATFRSGVWTGTVTIWKAQPNVVITTSGDGKSGTSNAFDVNPAPLDHIVSPDAVTTIAGLSVTCAVEAFDAYGNSFGDVTASASWSIDAAAGGRWSANVYTSAKAGTWTVTGTYSSVSDTATLTVNSASLDHFDLAPISSPQTAGAAFSITITAVDQYRNTVTVEPTPSATLLEQSVQLPQMHSGMEYGRARSRFGKPKAKL